MRPKRPTKLLIVEDDRQLADLTCMNFPKDRFETRAAYNGTDALAAVARERPDLIVLDVIMPGITGWEVLERLKADPATASIPVIVCTGKDSVEDVERSFRAGAQSYVIKPVDFQKLLRKVAAVLDLEELLNE